MNEVYLALGSNVGEPLANLQEAVRRLQDSGVQVSAASALYYTEPVGYDEQDDFLNAALRVETSLPPAELLALCKRIEREMGRQKTIRNGPRNIDLDILLYGAETVQSDDLIIPHPRLHERLFVLTPLADIAAAVAVPGHGRVDDLLAAYRGDERSPRRSDLQLQL